MTKFKINQKVYYVSDKIYECEVVRIMEKATTTTHTTATEKYFVNDTSLMYGLKVLKKITPKNYIKNDYTQLLSRLINDAIEKKREFHAYGFDHDMAVDLLGAENIYDENVDWLEKGGKVVRL